MGIDFNNSKAHWSYASFNRFRKRIAKEIDIDLDKMAGFTDGKGISWSTVKDDIKYLLNHSDCDGTLSWQKCGKVALRLKELTKNWENESDEREYLELIKSMIDCFEDKQPLVFM